MAWLSAPVLVRLGARRGAARATACAWPWPCAAFRRAGRSSRPRAPRPRSTGRRRTGTTGMGAAAGRFAAARPPRRRPRARPAPATAAVISGRWRECTAISGHGDRAADDRRARSTRRRRPSARVASAAAAEQLRDDAPRAPAREPAQAAAARRAGRAGRRGSPSSVHRCRRATSLARTPAAAASSSASHTDGHAVSRAAAVRRRFSRARASSERVVSTVVSSRPATSSCESPSSALITSTERWRSGSRWMSPSSARASARRASSSGSCAVSAGMPSSSMSPTARVRPRRSSSTHALCDEPQQPGARLERDDAAAQRGVHAQEDVLQHVVGIVAGGVQQPRRLAAQRRAVAFEHDRERLFVACGEAREEGAVLYWNGDGGVSGEWAAGVDGADVPSPTMCRLFFVPYDLRLSCGCDPRTRAARAAAYERARPGDPRARPRDGPAGARSRLRDRDHRRRAQAAPGRRGRRRRARARVRPRGGDPARPRDHRRRRDRRRPRAASTP